MKDASTPNLSTQQRAEENVIAFRNGIDNLSAAIQYMRSLDGECEMHGPELAATTILAMEALGLALNDLFEWDADGEYADQLVESLTDKTRAQIMLKMPWTQMHNPDGPLDKHFAVEVAETLGPDWAQALYRFAVLTTKVA